MPKKPSGNGLHNKARRIERWERFEKTSKRKNRDRNKVGIKKQKREK